MAGVGGFQELKMRLDAQTLRNLEVLTTTEGGGKGSLLRITQKINGFAEKLMLFATENIKGYPSGSPVTGRSARRARRTRLRRKCTC